MNRPADGERLQNRLLLNIYAMLSFFLNRHGDKGENDIHDFLISKLQVFHIGFNDQITQKHVINFTPFAEFLLRTMEVVDYGVVYIDNEEGKLVPTAIQFFGCWVRQCQELQPSVTVEQLPNELHQYGQKIVSQLSHKPEGSSLLHQFLSCVEYRRSYVILEYFNLEFVSLYLQCLLSWGCSELVNAADTTNAGKRPLHMCMDINDSALRLSLSEALLDNGAYANAVDAFGRIPLEYCTDHNSQLHCLLPSAPFSLSICSARAVVVHHIPYQHIKLPCHITSFIELLDHNAISLKDRYFSDAH